MGPQRGHELTLKSVRPERGVSKGGLGSGQMADRDLAHSCTKSVERLDLGGVRSPRLLRSMARREHALATDMSSMIENIHALLDERKKSP